MDPFSVFIRLKCSLRINLHHLPFQGQSIRQHAPWHVPRGLSVRPGWLMRSRVSRRGQGHASSVMAAPWAGLRGQGLIGNGSRWMRGQPRERPASPVPRSSLTHHPKECGMLASVYHKVGSRPGVLGTFLVWSVAGEVTRNRIIIDRKASCCSLKRPLVKEDP